MCNKSGLTADQPMSGGTAPDMHPISVFRVNLLFDHIVYRTTYVNQPIKATIAAVTVVKYKRISPDNVETTPRNNTLFNDNFPVTVGRSFVRLITGSISTSYQLFKTLAPISTNALPSIVTMNKPIFSMNDDCIK